METKEATGENVGSYAPAFLPAYAEEERPLILSGKPLQVTVQAEKLGAAGLQRYSLRNTG